MSRRFLAALVLLAAACSGTPHGEASVVRSVAAGVEACVVARIIDGDTFVCADGARVRLLLLDAPERGQGAYADSAARLLGRVMPVGTRVRLERDVRAQDRYRRLLAYVYAGDVFVNRELVRRGMAHVAVYPPNVREVETLRAAADSARAEGLGLWAGSAFECTPAEYRAGRCR